LNISGHQFLGPLSGFSVGLDKHIIPAGLMSAMPSRPAKSQKTLMGCEDQAVMPTPGGIIFFHSSPKIPSAQFASAPELLEPLSSFNFKILPPSSNPFYLASRLSKRPNP
jgi:hypothetical protein